MTSIDPSSESDRFDDDSPSDLHDGLDGELDLASERPAAPEEDPTSGSARLVGGIVVSALAIAGIILVARGSSDDVAPSEPSAVVEEAAVVVEEASPSEPEPELAAKDAKASAGKARPASPSIDAKSARAAAASLVNAKAAATTDTAAPVPATPAGASPSHPSHPKGAAALPAPDFGDADKPSTPVAAEPTVEKSLPGLEDEPDGPADEDDNELFEPEDADEPEPQATAAAEVREGSPNDDFPAS